MELAEGIKEMDTVEQFRYKVAEGTPDPEPPSYKEDYVLPVHRDKLLQLKFHHERDDMIHFYEKPHVYRVHGRAVDISVSSLIKDFIEHFDPDAIIEKMKNSRNEKWPKLKYAKGAEKIDNRDCHSPETVVLGVDRKGKTVFKGLLQAASAELDTYTFERAMTDEEIKIMWNDVEARNRGTEAHYQIELWINSEPARIDQPELRVGLDFIRDQLVPMGARGFRTEWEIFAEQEDVAGSVDCIAVLPDESLLIVDWKRTPSLKMHMHDHFGKSMKHPLSHLDDCDGCKYGIQLGVYAWIIEKYYGKKVKGLVLCSLHPDAPFHTWVPYMKEEVDYLMRKRREKVALVARANMDADQTYPRCALSGKLAIDAVSYNGKVYSEKELMAENEDAEYTVLEDEREKVASFLSTISPSKKISREEERMFDARPWKSRMPADGIQDFANVR